MTRTLGFDLAAESSNTGACVVEWDATGARVVDVFVGTSKRPLDNAEIVRLLSDAPVAGIDAPFGWPLTFLRAVSTWSDGAHWELPWNDDTRRRLRLRETDRWIASRSGHRAPLSVSADSIAVCAMRTAAILTDAMPEGVDRIGGPIYEVYPAATLREWGYDPTGYKSEPEARRLLLDSICGDWMDTGSHAEELVRTDHAFDALVSAIAARAAELGKVHPIPDEHRAAAGTEGWIQLPAVLPAQLVDGGNRS